MFSLSITMHFFSINRSYFIFWNFEFARNHSA